MKKSLLILITLMFVSCAQYAVNQRLKELKTELDPLVGRNEEEVVLKRGAPAEIQEAGGLKIYKFRKSFGHRGYSDAYSYQSHEKYDSYNIYFKDGKVLKWDAYVQR